jgi:hypothetical protein
MNLQPDLAKLNCYGRNYIRVHPATVLYNFLQSIKITRKMWQLGRLERQLVAGRRLRLKCDGTRAETRFRLSAKGTSPFKSAGASVQSTTGSRGVRINGSNARYTMFRGSVKSTGYPLHSPISTSLHLPCVTVCSHISTGVYLILPVQFNNNNGYTATPIANRVTRCS